MDSKSVLPLALGAGVVLAAILARKGSGGTPAVVQLGPTEPDPAVERSIEVAGETQVAKINAISELGGKAFDLLGISENANRDVRIASYAASRDVEVAKTEANRDTTIAATEANRDTTIAGFDFRTAFEGFRADMFGRAKNTERDIALEKEHTRQEEIRSRASIANTATQARTQTRSAEVRASAEKTSAIADTVGSVGGMIIGSLFAPGAGTAIGGAIGSKVGSFFSRLF